MMKHLNRFRLNLNLVRNTAVMYTAAIASGVVQYGVLIFVARRLGAADLGVIVLATTIGSFTAAALELGIVPILIRFREDLERRAPDVWAGIVRLVCRIVLTGALALVAVALVILIVSLEESSNHALRAVALGLALAAPTALLTVFQGYLQSLRRFRAIAVLSVASAFVRLGIIVVIGAAGRLSASSVLGAYIVTAAGAAGVAWLAGIRSERFAEATASARRRARALVLPYLRWSTIGRASVALNGRADIFLLSLLAGPQPTGIYGAASQSAAPTVMLATAVGEVSFPHLAVPERASSPRNVVRRWFPWLPVFAIAGAIGAAVGAYVLPYLLGSNFEASAVPFALLFFTYSIHVWIQPIGLLLYAADRQRRAATIAVMQTVLLIVFNLILIPPYGALGPALAILLTTCFMLPITVLAAIREDTSNVSPSAGDVRA